MSGTVGMDVVVTVNQVAAVVVTGCVVLAVLAGPGGKSLRWSAYDVSFL